jgi:hypothetical protein
MKSLLPSKLWKTTPLIIQLFLIIGSATILQAGDYSGGSSRGYLTVYLTTDEFNDRNAWYFPRSFFAIYTIDGRLFKNVESQHFADEEIPEVVGLPVGSYMVVARSERDGYIRLPVAIKAGRRTVLDLDLRQEGTLSRLAQN